MSMHSLFGRHVVDSGFSHWDAGHFVSRCTICQKPMVKLPGLPWGLRGRA